MRAQSHAERHFASLPRAKDIGFDAVDGAPLRNARALETMGFFNIQLGCTLGLGTKMGIRLFHDEPRR